MKPDHRTPLARERDAWLDSEMGKDVCDALMHDLIDDEVARMVGMAFDAGYTHADRIRGKETKE